MEPRQRKLFIPRDPPYPPVGQCIYCGATRYSIDQRKLGKEHIIPLGLSGDRILPEASCRRCERITGPLEGKVFSNHSHLLGVRLAMGLASRGKSGSREQRKVSIFTDVDGQGVKRVELPWDVAPKILTLPIFEPPHILTGRRLDDAFINLRMGFINLAYDEADMRRRGIVGFSPPDLEIHTFVRFIAKVAHAFAAATYGIENFEPTLRGVIVGEGIVPGDDGNEQWGYVGGYGDHKEPPSSNLHELDAEIEVIDGMPLIVVRVRLLAILGLPAYCVVAGRMPGLLV